MLERASVRFVEPEPPQASAAAPGRQQAVRVRCSGSLTGTFMLGTGGATRWQ